MAQQRFVQFVGAQAGVGPRIAVEDELGVVGVGQGDEGQGRARLAVQADTARLHALGRQRGNEVVAKGVVAHLADEGAGQPQPPRGHSHVARRAARLGVEGADLDQAAAAFGREEVNEEFA